MSELYRLAAGDYLLHFATIVRSAHLAGTSCIWLAMFAVRFFMMREGSTHPNLLTSNI